jgi:cobalt/nickel transport system permease protein
MLAMHMANELLTPGVALVFIVFAAVALAFASWRTRQRFDPAMVPLMGVMGAFVFAAQMINFPILPGTSGHMGGGVLLAIILGPHAATLVMASILIVQCLIFQDGGLLALGTNILNLGIVPCYLGYAIFISVAGRRPGAGRLYLAVFTATMVGMMAGAALVPVEVTLSGVAAVPFTRFLLVMVGLHLLVAAGEAIITFLVVGYLAKVRPQSLGPIAERLAPAGAGLGPRAVTASLFVAALLLGGVVSLLASSAPDALESVTSPEGEPGQSLVDESTHDETIARTSQWQEKSAPLPDYQFGGAGEYLGTTISGVVGTLVTLLVVWLIGRALRRPRRDAHVHGTSG